jgi:hypothetical protein
MGGKWCRCASFGVYGGKRMIETLRTRIGARINFIFVLRNIVILDDNICVSSVN